MLGLINSEFPTVLAVDLVSLYPLQVSVTGRYLFLLLELSAGYSIPSPKGRSYHTYLATIMLYIPYNGSLRSYKACPPRESYRGYQHTKLALITTQISQTGMYTDQISATDVSPRRIIVSCRHRSPPQLCNQSKPM